MTQPGCFIVIEGSDGSGKTTQVERLLALFKSEGREVALVRDPGGCDQGEMIRSLLLSPTAGWNGLEELLLFMAARSGVVRKVIRPALEAGKVVLADRFIDSTQAYQIIGRKQEHLQSAFDLLTEEICGDVKPNLTVILDIPSSVARSRTRRRGYQSRIDAEVADFHRRVGKAYRRIGELWPRHVLVNGNRDPDLVFEDIVAHVRTVLPAVVP